MSNTDRSHESPAGRPTLLLVGDPGGHLFELVGLRAVWSQFSRTWVTVEAADAETLLAGEEIVFAHGPTRRSGWNLLRNLLLALRVLRRLRPAVVLTTGAGLAVPFAWVGRLYGARVVYLECSGRVGLSLSARFISPIAHRLYVQWPEALESSRKARYAGSVFLSRA